MPSFPRKSIAATALGAVASLFFIAPTGAEVLGNPSVVIDDPVDGQHVDVTQALPVGGQLTMANGGPTATNAYYLLDVSLFASILAGGCGDDPANTDATECLRDGVAALNGALGQADLDVSIIAFGGSQGALPGAVAADMSPDDGDQPFTVPGADLDADGTLDVDEVLDGISFLGASEFSEKMLGPGTFADFDTALEELSRLIGLQPAGERNLAFVLSPGDFVNSEVEFAAAAEGDAPLDDLVGLVTINTFAIDGGTPFFVGCEGTLGEIADATGGQCVDNPTEADYVNVIADSAIAVLSSFTLTANGSDVDVVLGPDGLFSATVPAGLLHEAQNPIVATAEVQVVASDSVETIVASDTVVVIGEGPSS